MKYYDVYISKKNDNHSVILRTNEPLETLELWIRAVVNKYYPDFEIIDVDRYQESFFLFNNKFQFVHVMFIGRDCYCV